ncbi:CHC2 zinc finger domain-containing protein [Streptacidiphilus sp. N1-12]|uniref:CHC2 zinc finger domain-containing protein n=1 Tax=Streptacidiphilus alkalitolerans TaxID=3342712 RepID=A0ABV6WR74_9ACTN
MPYVALEPGGGGQLKGLCPFCSADEFYISPAKAVFSCFGCKQCGDTIGFLMLAADVDYATAQRMLDS